MENEEKQIKEDPKNPTRPESLSEAELDKVAGGGTFSTTRSNIKRITD
ncbi:MAG: hypothetical protein ABSB15_27685 [Bryobacteraceae bacterium]